ncbi:thioredoxin fold domain-containing protein [Flavihumibacter petaseus]|uniref:Thioredoxin domain-containing protein n=1 Tax=Flavihumibacter petaseus NBRC 106054 TaxID=1220578 RepID=A0A0E9N5S0_9BACT|nr:thioredoxin fold domain-containing protein [Flavihumibacter petaseus]GAO44690.1 hypothetical protein FPE01S_03_07290 [Flavihumibacter petaseus NBRC 106054]
MRTIILISWLTLIAGGICRLFWQQEWKYRLPTPVPANYHAVAQGSQLSNQALLPQTPNDQTPTYAEASVGKANSKPVFLHFFNPDCPCSRFNMPQVKELIREYGDQVNFIVVALAKENWTPEAIQSKFDLSVPVVTDSALAATCGVYSTPQAAIIDAEKKLFYRGNYNRTRYCTDPKTNFAQIALEALLARQPMPLFGDAAFKSYGCELPVTHNPL